MGSEREGRVTTRTLQKLWSVCIWSVCLLVRGVILKDRRAVEANTLLIATVVIHLCALVLIQGVVNLLVASQLLLDRLLASHGGGGWGQRGLIVASTYMQYITLMHAKAMNSFMTEAPGTGMLI